MPETSAGTESVPATIDHLLDAIKVYLMKGAFSEESLSNRLTIWLEPGDEVLQRLFETKGETIEIHLRRIHCHEAQSLGVAGPVAVP